MTSFYTIRRQFCAAIMLTGLLALTACIENKNHQGYRTEFADLSLVTPHQSSKEEVQVALGSPTLKSMYGKETWYYSGSAVRTSTLAMPEVEKHRVIIVTFSDEGIVQSIEERDENAIRNVKLAEEQTPTEGKQSVTIVEQLLGNLGRFNPKEQ